MDKQGSLLAACSGFGEADGGRRKGNQSIQQEPSVPVLELQSLGRRVTGRPSDLLKQLPQSCSQHLLEPHQTVLASIVLPPNTPDHQRLARTQQLQKWSDIFTRLPTETLRKQAHCATGYRRHQQARRDARGTPQRVKRARALPTATTALPPAAARTFGFAAKPEERGSRAGNRAARCPYWSGGAQSNPVLPCSWLCAPLPYRV
ncbi:PREDICTED: uncharacterized protein LOC103893859 [Aptenodytes forsteri]|uniref:uncharacterized protein LOC103893859 n=1 Tax=Aptenodytes forsteri TaxID=9233 RepID=UPI0009053D64|nr:PREDICTED: uncharacterized protein LOC103893859 [Aptenodytes forsteri]